MVDQPIVQIRNNQDPQTVEAACHRVPQPSKNLRGCVQTEGKYPKLNTLLSKPNLRYFLLLGCNPAPGNGCNPAPGSMYC